MSKRKGSSSKSLLDDDLVVVSDDDDTIESSGDICGRRSCGLERSRHREGTEECPNGRGKFLAGA